MDDWNLLRTFLEVTRQGTLAGAAATLGSSVATVHRHLRALEKKLDARLLERRGARSQLTAAGEALLPFAERVEHEMHALARTIRGTDLQPRGAVSITTPDTLAHTLLLDALPELRDKLPEIELTIFVDNRHFRLGRGEADIALRPSPQPTELDVVARHLGDLTFAYYASVDYLEVHGRPRRKRDLSRHAALVPDASLARTVFAEASRRFDPDKIVLRSPSLALLGAAVERGLGVAALPCPIMQRSERVEALFTPEFDSPLWLLFHVDHRNTARVQAVVDALDAYLRPRLA